MKSFENTVARFRKTAEMVEELKGYVNALSAERDALETEIVAHCAEHPDVYNVFVRKNASAGLVGKNLFTVTFSDQLKRRLSGRRLDDQLWLNEIEGISDSEIWRNFVKTKKALNVAGIVNAHKTGQIDNGDLRLMGLTFAKAAHVTAQRIPNDAELSAIRRDAEALAEDAEA